MAPRVRIAILCLLLAAGCARLRSCSFFASTGWEIDAIQERWNSADPLEDLVGFRNGTTWSNVGMQIEHVATIRGHGDSRILGFRALSCVECEPDLLLTIRSTAGERVLSEPYPGKITRFHGDVGESADRPFAEFRAYYGACAPAHSPETFVVDSIALGDNSASHQVIESTENGLKTTRTEVTPGEVRGFVPPAGCREIKGVNREIE